MAKKKLELVRTEPRQLSFPLTKEELDAKHQQLVDVLAEKERQERLMAEDGLKAKEVKAGHMAKLNTHEKDIKILREQIASRSEVREVECEVYANPETSAFEIHNPNIAEGRTGRVVATVPMTLLDKSEAEQLNAARDAALTEDEAAAIADSEEETAKPKKGKAAKPKGGDGSTDDPKPKANGKAKSGKAQVSNADMSGVENQPALVTLPGGKGGKDIEV